LEVETREIIEWVVEDKETLILRRASRAVGRERRIEVKKSVGSA
jgi:hypothetical protein